MQRNGITVEPLNFPATQSVLWNRTAQGESETLHLTTKRNVRLYINEKTVRLAHRHVSQTKSSFECFLVGSISVDSREDSIDVVVDRFDPGREVLVNNGSGKVKRKVPTTVVPGDHIVPISLIQGLSGADSSVTHTKDELHKAFQVLFGRMSSQEPVNLSHLVSLKVCCHSHGDDDEIIINVNCGAITMGTQILATPVTPVPIIPTALARNLSGPLRLSEVQGMPKTGYLTMDHTRKLLLLLESDPKAFSLPLLGIWVSGTYSIYHPFIWACCLRFIHSTAIQQRVFAPPNSFLLLLYSPVKTTPEFWECHQDLGQPEVMFEFYSCYENLHLEIPPSPSSSDPLCFDLFPAAEGMGRSLFKQAMEIWEKENKSTRPNQDGINPHQQPAIRQGSGEEEPSPEPRPSPSPHPQNLQFILPDVAETSLSLSFEEQVPGERSEQGYANQQILPRPKWKQQQTKTEEKTQKQVQHNQENGQMGLQEERSPGFFQGKQNVKQFRNNGAQQNSPSREPLKQILPPNQTHAKVMNQKQSFHKPHSTQGSAVVQKAPFRRGSGPGRNMQGRSSPKAFTDNSIPRSTVSGKQPPPKKHNAAHETDLKADQQKHKIATQKMRSEPLGCKGMNSRALTNLQNQQVISSNQQDDINRGRQVDQQYLVKLSDDQKLDHNSCPLPVNPEQRPFLETVFEGQTPDGTLNKSMSETGFELRLTETSQASKCSSILEHSQRDVHNVDSESQSSSRTGLILDQGEKQSAFFRGVDKQKQQGFVQTEWNTDIRDERFIQPIVCRTDGNEERLDSTADHTSKERLGNTADPISNRGEHQQVHKRERRQSKPTEEHTNEKSHEGAFQENNKLPAEVTRSDPYELLMRQDAQLRELQEQIKLLLQQQLPTGNPLLTPPRTPHFERLHGNSKPTDNSPVSMVTACTNTGASLLLGTPVKPRGKRSATTSPMKEKEMSHSAERRSLPASSMETSQHNSKELQKHDSTVNPEELANQLIELDDPSQTLASSLHAVDIPSFVESPSGVTSPSPTDQDKRGGMETSFASPVLGESASILVEERQNAGGAHNTGDDGVVEEESRGVKSNHVSLLQRNERQFYDNLLNQVKNILDQQPQEESSEEHSQKDEQKEHVTLHETTREEVVMATMKELQKIQSSTLETGNMEAPMSSFGAKQWPIHRSASLSAISDHPHINYMSFSVDETLDEVFNETYLKYLTESQLQELQEMRGPHKKHSRDRAVTFSVLQDGKSTLLRRGSVDKETLCDSSSISSMDYTWNNLSMATKEYLGKYCLVTSQRNVAGSSSGELTAAKKVTDMSSGSARSQTSVTSQGCKAPPCTPDPANQDGNDSQILDITRLKKLPKLF